MASDSQPVPEPSSDTIHIPVLLDQVVAFVQPRPGGVYVDCTTGGGGHAETILRHSEPDGVLIGLDRDPQALEVAARRLASFGTRVRLVHATFDRVDQVVRAEGFEAVDGVIADVGVSSLQLDTAERGFSWRYDAPLDLRMDPTQGPTAADLIQELPERELERLLRELGEERYAGRIARAIAREREREPIRTTLRLAEVVRRAVPAGYRHGRIHPATRTFQALRVRINSELEMLESCLHRGVEILRRGGRIVVICYHSLEDRIVKTGLRRLAGKGQPAGEGPAPVLRLLTPKPVVPEATEIATNPRARSAKLRAAEKTG